MLFRSVFIEIDPSRIDINVHPTKQEIKFEDERLVYNYLKVAVRHALGQNAVTPLLDFETESGFLNRQSPVVNREDGGNHDAFDPFPTNRDASILYRSSETVSTGKNSSPSSFEKTKNDLNFKKPATLERANLDNWQRLYQDLEWTETTDNQSFAAHRDDGFVTVESNFERDDDAPQLDDTEGSFSKQQTEPYQLHTTYIVSPIKSGFMLIDQQAASERILYERYLHQLENRQAASQTQLFPKTIHFSPSDAALLTDVLTEINHLGFDVQQFGNCAFIVHGLPNDWQGSRDEQKVLENLLEQYKTEADVTLNNAERIAASMARSAATKRGTPLSIREMKELIDQLFGCAMPFKSPNGRNCFVTFDLEDVQKMFLS